MQRNCSEEDLDEIAKVTISDAKKPGNKFAREEIGNRFDGRATQMIGEDPESPIRGIVIVGPKEELGEI